MIKFILWILGIRAICKYRGDGFIISSVDVALNLPACIELLESEAFTSIKTLTDKPVNIQFKEDLEDGVSVKVFRRWSRYNIRVCGSNPELGLARGLDSLWRFLANVGAKS